MPVSGMMKCHSEKGGRYLNSFFFSVVLLPIRLGSLLGKLDAQDQVTVTEAVHLLTR